MDGLTGARKDGNELNFAESYEEQEFEKSHDRPYPEGGTEH